MDTPCETFFAGEEEYVAAKDRIFTLSKDALIKFLA
jgi:hypothetical protein